MEPTYPHFCFLGKKLTLLLSTIFIDLQPFIKKKNDPNKILIEIFPIAYDSKIFGY